MVTVGFLLGKEQKPKVEVKSKNAKFISFLMPIGSKPGETITVPISGIKVVVKIPISLGEIGGDDSEIPRENEYIKNILRMANNIRNLKKTLLNLCVI